MSPRRPSPASNGDWPPRIDEIDPDGTEPALAVAAALVSYLATSPRHAPLEPDRLIEQALRVQFGDDVPESIAP
jgi:hypothetical protein